LLFRVLGRLEVADSADPMPAYQERLLALLLRHANSWVDADTVVGTLWPQDPPASAKGNVKTYVHQLRQMLPRALDGSPRINSRLGEYRLNLERSELDAAVFEDLVGQGRAALEAGNAKTALGPLTEALGLWRGEPYGPLGAELAESESARLRGLRDEALDAYQAAQEARANEPAEEPEAERTVVLRFGPPEDVRQPVPDKKLEPWSQWRVEEQPPKPKRRLRAVLLAVVIVLVVGAVTGTVVLTSRDDSILGQAGPTGSSGASASSGSSSAQPPDTTTTQAQPAVSPKRPVPGLPPPGTPKLLFGIGDRADTARLNALVRDTPTRMLTTWYRGHDDLAKLRPLKDTAVKQAYADGFALHLIVTATGQATTFDSARGPACGRPAALASEFLADVQVLAEVFGGTAQSPPLFVTVFDQAETLACNPAGFKADAPTTAYFRSLKDQYVLTRETFHHVAPNALVSLGWGTGLARAADDPATGSGLAMLKNFNEVLAWSDFYSVSVTNAEGSNAEDVRAMVSALGKYGPVMLSWYSPAGSARVADGDVRALFTDARLAELTRDGLFAWSFAPDTIEASSSKTAAFITDAIRRYGRPA
jgi:hypothetical protein